MSKTYAPGLSAQAAKTMKRFEDAVRRHEFKGSADPEEFDDIEADYVKAKDAMVKLLSTAPSTKQVVLAPNKVDFDHATAIEHLKVMHARAHGVLLELPNRGIKNLADLGWIEIADYVGRPIDGFAFLEMNHVDRIRCIFRITDGGFAQLAVAEDL